MIISYPSLVSFITPNRVIWETETLYVHDVQIWRIVLYKRLCLSSCFSCMCFSETTSFLYKTNRQLTNTIFEFANRNCKFHFYSIKKILVKNVLKIQSSWDLIWRLLFPPRLTEVICVMQCFYIPQNCSMSSQHTPVCLWSTDMLKPSSFMIRNAKSY